MFYLKVLSVVFVLLAVCFLVVNFFSGKNMENQNLIITSLVFNNNESIPAKYTCDGENVNPPLKISGISDKAKSLVLIVEDPDVPKFLREDGMWNHWIKFNIPVSGSEFIIKEGIEPIGISGIGTSGYLNYHGPCPPDREHRYFLKIYSLDTMLNLPEGSTKEEIENAMSGHILQKGELIGLYNRNK